MNNENAEQKANSPLKTRCSDAGPWKVFQIRFKFPQEDEGKEWFLARSTEEVIRTFCECHVLEVEDFSVCEVTEVSEEDMDILKVDIEDEEGEIVESMSFRKYLCTEYYAGPRAPEIFAQPRW